MASRIPHSSSYPQAVDQVHRALTSEQYWRDRIAEVGGEGASLGHVTVGKGTVDVEMTQSVPAAHLPAIVTKIRPGDLIITRTETWGPLDGTSAEGTFTARVDGVPATLSGTMSLAADGAGTALTLDGKVEVKLPLIGGKIESVIADQVTELLDNENEFTARWLNEHV
ncbi:DUF2505 domain-containing protein [Rhodococcus spelaei]|uniref:DUF2505 domain-containing protein n=1 Tax=Rhodococcus spelaei TaxID=2546320 RepID=A0A541B8B1_9NOCA|nr:DUF2505 domain-containing protein [Rhodococcus spelaei]TQF68561.1 DUF2505 domain-containing protein [Rhodococcus spelaei]